MMHKAQRKTSGGDLAGFGHGWVLILGIDYFEFFLVIFDHKTVK